MTTTSLLSDLRILDQTTTGAGGTCVRILAQLGASVRRVVPDSAISRLNCPTEARLDALVVDEGEGLPPLEQMPWVMVSIASPVPMRRDASSDRSADEWRLDDPVTAALTGAHAAVALLAGIRWSRAHGQPVSIEVAALEILAACYGDALPDALCPRSRVARGAPPRRSNPIHLLPCSDGYVGLSISTGEDRTYLGALTGVGPESLRDDGMVVALVGWARGRTRDEIFHQAQLWRLPVVPVLTPDEVRTDEQSRERAIWTQEASGRVVLESPFRVATSGPTCGLPCPELGREKSSATSSSALPLNGLRVADLGMVWAGPYASRLLAGLGAQVIKVEGPRRPDGTRASADPGDCAGAFADLNRGKTSLVLDLSLPEGRDAFLNVSQRLDVLLENFSPRVMPNFGLGYPILSKTNPSLIMVDLPAFGSSGPWANYVAYGSGLELVTGLAEYDDGKPSVASVPYLDYLVGTCGAAAVLAALHARERTGHGYQIEVAQREVACQLLSGEYGGRPAAGRMASEHHDLGLDARSPWHGKGCAKRLAADPQLHVTGLFAAPDHAAPTCHHLARLPWLIHGIDQQNEMDAPSFGANSRETLRDLAGLDEAQIDDLVGLGVVVDASPSRTTNGAEPPEAERSREDSGNL